MDSLLTAGTVSGEHNDQLKAVLLHILQSECRGRHCGLTHRQLAERLQCQGRRERRLVNELVLAGELIGATPQWGVFWVVDEEDYREAHGDLAAHAYPIMERLRALERAYHQSFPPKQGELWEGLPFSYPLRFQAIVIRMRQIKDAQP